MDIAHKLENLMIRHNAETDFSSRLKIRNEMLGEIVPCLYNFDAQPAPVQDIIIRFADSVAKKNADTTLYDFLRYQDNPALKSSDTFEKLSGTFNTQKLHMQAFSEGLLADFDMTLSPWGNFVLQRMRLFHEKLHACDVGQDDKVIPFPVRDRNFS